jgi:predicted DNA-binding transcriptional regulator YafY
MAKMNCFEKVFHILNLFEKKRISNGITAKDIELYFKEILHKDYSNRQAQKDMNNLQYLADVEFNYMLEVIKNKPLTIKIKSEKNVLNLFLKKYRYERLVEYLKKSKSSCQSIIHNAKDMFNEDVENIFNVSGCSIDNTIIDDDDFEILKTAIKEHRLVKFKYKNHKGVIKNRQNFKPYRILIFDDGWYLAGQFIDENDYRTFSMNKISDINLQNEEFQDIPKDFEETAKHAKSPWFITTNKINVEAVLSSNISYKFLEMEDMGIKYFSYQKIIEDRNPYGDIKVKFKVADDPYGVDFKKQVYPWLPDIKILRPKKLLNQIKKDFEVLIK